MQQYTDCMILYAAIGYIMAKQTLRYVLNGFSVGQVT